jgi:hypothetical protein
MTNPMKDVRYSCGKVVEKMNFVTINDAELNSRVIELIDCYNEFESDSVHWHYDLDAKLDGKLTIQYLFVVDALNFCFWPSETFEYEVLALSLKHVLENDSNAFNAESLATISEVFFT